MTISPPTTWTLAGHVATQVGGGVEVALDLDRPRDGLTVTAGGCPDHLLGVELGIESGGGDERPGDLWLRGADVNAVYEPADPRRLRATAMWRPFSVAGLAAWELVASAQTSLPASDAALAVVADLAATEVLWSVDPSAAEGWRPLDAAGRCGRDTTALLVRRPAPHGGRATSVLLSVHPADARTITVVWRDERLVVSCWLFSAAIEKGVLLRGRVLAAIGPAADDTVWARRLAGEFASSATPLSA